MFCLCPRELVGPAGLCAQVLSRRCRCGPWQAARLLISQSSSFGLGLAQPADPAALGLSLWGMQGRFGTEHAALGTAVLSLWVEQLASAPDALPPEVSGVGAPPGFPVWAPSLLICVHATRLQVRPGAVHPPGAEWGEAPEVVAAGESSLTSP